MRTSGPRLPAPSVLFPWRAWLTNAHLRHWTTWLFITLVAVPPLALSLISSGSADIGTATAAFAFYFAAAWFLALRVVVSPQRVRGQLLAQVVALSLIVEFPLAYFLEEALDSQTENPLLAIVTVGIPEEVAKLLPVAVLALFQRRVFSLLAPRDFLFLGAVSGLTFGAMEAVHYAVNVMDVSSTQQALVLVWRLVTDPIAHACWAGIAGYFLGLATRYENIGRWLALTGTGAGLTAILHGLNDVVAGQVFVLWLLITVASTLLFLAYARAGLAPPPARRNPGPSPRVAPTILPFAAADSPTMPIPRSPTAHQSGRRGPAHYLSTPDRSSTWPRSTDGGDRHTAARPSAGTRHWRSTQPAPLSTPGANAPILFRHPQHAPIGDGAKDHGR